MKTTNLDDILIQQPYFYGGTENGKPFLNTLGRELKAQLEQLIREQRAEELRLRLTTNISSPERDWIEKRIAELTDSHKEEE